MIQQLISQLEEALKGTKPKVDKAKVRCFRCQKFGHYASECMADKPTFRRYVNGVFEDEEIEEN